MVDRNNAGGRARTWPERAAAWRLRAPAWADDVARMAGLAGGRLREWIVADTGPGRLVPWLPIGFGLGIAIYFTADHEPVWWAGIAASIAGIAASFSARARPIAFPAALAITAVASGFAIATLRGVYVSHPVLTYPVSGAEITGFVEVREERERSDRIVVRISRIEAPRLNERLERVRVSVRKGTAPAVGAYVTFKARLNPPLQPLRPGGYDFARDLYFQGLGASGFVLGRIRVDPALAPQGLWLRYATAIAGMRDAIDARVRGVVPGDRGSIASALITGKRDAISAPVNDAMYISSLAHVLSISGYHMAVVAGVVFFCIRALLALMPGLANRRPIKKWAAFAALGAAAFYLVLSGAEVATQRSFIMTSVVLIGVIFDRPALTLRTIAVAALAVLMFHPESLTHPSFQMSFAATLALIAGYERGLPWLSAVPASALGMRVALWGGREIVGLVLASVLAGLATTPYAAFHFHRLAPYGVIANLLAMPIVSAWVMPAGIVAVLALPFGLDSFFWRLMGDGIDWMIAVALWVAALPGAVGRMSAFGTGPLLLGTAGLILLCLLRTPLRWSGAIAAVVACAWAISTPQPDVLVSHDGQTAAVRGATGRLSILRQGSDDFTIREWLAADADGRSPRDPSLKDGVSCDRSGCLARLPDNSLVALSLHPESLDEDCRRTAVVLSAQDAPRACAAFVVDRTVSRANGAVALQRANSSFDLVGARPAGQDRPWARPVPGRGSTPAAATMIRRPASRDATPRPEDLETGD